ncbi:F-box domain containing protein [Parasponia andersonii]|uniref:F-box domain containing protein n=1 Tax=Parasponia andersonii TaxID=3476 RepID=A0A2P5D925_PARAD|nr:F-box domain containing protein [Parasponia andersonii]
MESSMILCSLPEEVVVEIMSRLPVESLMRFKCVNKSWYSLINSLIKDPKFMTKHLHNMNNVFLVLKSHRLYFGSFRRRNWAVLTILNVDDDDDNDSPICVTTSGIGVPRFLGKKDMSNAEAYHCNGLICFVNTSETIMLCNPVLDEHVFLPQSDYVSKYECTRLGLGFGYDSRANDYKVIRILRIYMTSEVIEERAEVYSLSTNLWRETELPLHYCMLRRLCGEVYCKGAYYWATWALENVILCFDMSDEKFHCIPLPEDMYLR